MTSHTHTPTLLLADDQAIVRKGIIASIQNDNAAFKIVEVSDFRSMRQMMERRIVTHLILDLKMSDCAFLEPFNFVRRHYPDTLVMVFSAAPFALVEDTLLRGGTSGYLSKQTTTSELTYGLNHFLQQGTYFPSHIKRKKEENDLYNPFSVLSERELVVAGYLLQGLTLKIIANTLSISISAVSTYKIRVLNKLKVDNIVSVGKMAAIFSFPL